MLLQAYRTKKAMAEKLGVSMKNFKENELESEFERVEVIGKGGGVVSWGYVLKRDIKNKAYLLVGEELRADNQKLADNEQKVYE